MQSVTWDPTGIHTERRAHLDHVSHVALGPRVVRLVLLAHQHDEVQVVPDVVLQLDVLLEGHRLVVELVPLQTCTTPESERGPAATPLPPAGSKGARLLTADEAGGLQDLLLLLLLATQVGEGVDDHAEDEVQDDDDDDEVKQQVVHDAGGE